MSFRSVWRNLNQATRLGLRAPRPQLMSTRFICSSKVHWKKHRDGNDAEHAHNKIVRAEMLERGVKEEDVHMLQQARAFYHDSPDGEAKVILEMARILRKQKERIPLIYHLKELMHFIDDGNLTEEALTEEDKAWVYYELGQNAFVVGDFGEAIRHLHAARFSAHLSKNHNLEARAFVYLGRLYSKQGDEKGMQLIRRGADLMAQLKDGPGQRQALMALADAQSNADLLDEAIETYGLAVTFAQEVKDIKGEARIYRHVASVLRRKDDLRSALQAYKKAILLSEQAGDQLGLATSSLLAGNTMYEIAKSADSVTYWKHAVQTCENIKAPTRVLLPVQTEALSRLISHYEDNRLFEVAVPYRSALVDVLRNSGHKRGVATALLELAETNSRLGNAEEAKKGFEEAQAIAQEVKDELTEVLAVTGITTTLFQLGNHHGVRAQIETAKSMLNNLSPDASHASSRSRALAVLADVAAQIGDADNAREMARGSLRAAKKAGGGEDLICAATISLARAALMADDLEGAKDYAGNALADGIRHKIYPVMTSGLEVLGDVSFKEKNWTKAADYYQKVLALASRSDAHWKKSHALQRLGDISEEAGNLKGAIGYHIQAVNSIPEQRQRPLAFKSFTALGRIHKKMGNDLQADSYNRLATELAKK